MNDVPGHVAIIMDGNGRWATQQKKNRSYGHKQGVTAAREIVIRATELGIKTLSLFAFSSENRARPRTEVMALTELFADSLNQEIDDWMQYGVRLHFIGDLSFFQTSLRQRMTEIENKTQHLEKLSLNIALNYSGRWDIATSVQKLLSQGASSDLHNHVKADAVVRAISSQLAVADVDLLIRTGRERRISNFLIWQCAYAELYFSDTLWPDFSIDEFATVMAWYASRERRFGMTEAQQ